MYNEIILNKKELINMKQSVKKYPKFKDIKQRKGKLISGIYIKEEDLG